MMVQRVLRFALCVACAFNWSCAGSNPLSIESTGTRASGPAFSEVRERFEELKRLDPSLMVGFYTSPLFPDFTSRLQLLGPEVRSSAASPSEEEIEFIRALTETVAPETWNDMGKTISFEGEWMVVFQTEEVLKQIPEAIEKIQRERLEGRPIIATTIRFAEIEAGHPLLDEVLASQPDPVDDGTPPVMLTEEQATSLLEVSDVLSAPRLALLENQRGSVYIGNERAYLADYEIYYVNSEKIADPIVRTLTQGYSATLRTTVAEDASAPMVTEVTVSTSKLLSMDEAQIQVGEQSLTVELPQVKSQTITARIAAQPGQVALLRAKGGDGHSLLVFIESAPATGK